MKQFHFGKDRCDSSILSFCNGHVDTNDTTLGVMVLHKVWWSFSNGGTVPYDIDMVQSGIATLFHD